MLAQLFNGNANHFELSIIIAVVVFIITAVVAYPRPTPGRLAGYVMTLLCLGLAVFAFAFVFLF